jgi:DNA modification methylase
MINQIFHGDCLEVMKDLPNESIDHIICDLPFYKVVKDDWDNQWNGEEEYLIWCRNVIGEYKRILKKNGNILLFTSRQYNRKISLMLDELFVEKRIIIWARKRNMNNTRGRALTSGYEPISYYCNGETGVFNNIKIQSDSKRPEYTKGVLKDGISLSDVWVDIPALPYNSKERLGHSTQKPLKLIKRLVYMFSNEHDLILDHCYGSGTLGEACMELNRNYIMIEKDFKSFDIAVNRMKKYKL